MALRRQQWRARRATNRATSAPVRAFLNIIKGMSWADLRTMMSFYTLYDRINYYRHETKTAVKLSLMDRSSIPWPIVWFLGR